MSRNPKSLLLVFVQALLLIYLFLSGEVLPLSPLSGLFELAGVLLFVWAIWSMRVTTIQITADVAPDSNLVTDGPYEFIRHPMYVAVILVAIGLLINTYSLPRLFAVLLLACDFGLKASYEETLLVKYFKKGYEDYREKTKRFIPLIY
ncbi:MAG TPA: isoprenylcysteine carboxylmethyltransferase family protein [Patescibacteria group bacterium]|nr:isoprenylcysteine carboxylmethyltransferase family protein [Patescibacteria group bacterium]